MCFRTWLELLSVVQFACLFKASFCFVCSNVGIELDPVMTFAGKAVEIKQQLHVFRVSFMFMSALDMLSSMVLCFAITTNEPFDMYVTSISECSSVCNYGCKSHVYLPTNTVGNFNVTQPRRSLHSSHSHMIS